MASEVIFLGDTHFGLRNSNTDHHEYMESFFKDFFSYIDEHQIKYIVQLGDLFDVRKNINVWTINFFRKVFLDEITKRSLSLYVLLGNHDIYYRESLEVNSVREILHSYQQLNPDILTIIDTPVDINIGGTDFLICPWVCKENEAEVFKAVSKSKSKYCVGHFEFNGFEMQKGQVITTRHSHTDYKKFKLVISGHYHHKSKKDNVLYAGTPYQITWMDYNDDKGFWIFSDGDMSFIKNRHTIYNKVDYSDGFLPEKNEVYKKYVHVTLRERIEPKYLNHFIDSIQLMEPLDMKVKESFADSFSDEVIDAEIKDTEEVLAEYVNTASIDVDKQKMVSIMQELYRTAISS
jgi:DNA repair exonuclease SbcCD nuclease subunit